jgi:hypothetical protein
VSRRPVNAIDLPGRSNRPGSYVTNSYSRVPKPVNIRIRNSPKFFSKEMQLFDPFLVLSNDTQLIKRNDFLITNVQSPCLNDYR